MPVTFTNSVLNGLRMPPGAWTFPGSLCDPRTHEDIIAALVPEQQQAYRDALQAATQSHGGAKP